MFPGCLVLRIQCFHCCGPGSVSGWGTEIPQDTWHGQNKKIKKQTTKKPPPKTKPLSSLVLKTQPFISSRNWLYSQGLYPTWLWFSNSYTQKSSTGFFLRHLLFSLFKSSRKNSGQVTWLISGKVSCTVECQCMEGRVGPLPSAIMH